MSYICLLGIGQQKSSKYADICRLLDKMETFLNSCILTLTITNYWSTILDKISSHMHSPWSSKQCVGLLDIRPRFKHQVRERNTYEKNISPVTFSQQISGQKSESKKNCHRKLSKICRSVFVLFVWFCSLHSCLTTFLACNCDYWP